MPVHVLAKVQSPLDVYIRLEKDHRTLFYPYMDRIIFPNLLKLSAVLSCSMETAVDVNFMEKLH